MLDENKQMKFEPGSKTEVVIKSMGMEDSNFGSEYVVRIKETIDGYDHIKPSDGLKNKMIEKNLSADDKIVIEKVAPSEKYQYGYFSVEMADNPVKAVDPAVHDHPMGAGFAQKDEKIGQHELKMRVETLERYYGEMRKEVDILRKEVDELKKDAIPF